MKLDTKNDAANQHTEIDNEARASYTYMEPFGRKVVKTVVISETENRDYDADGKIIGIERFW